MLVSPLVLVLKIFKALVVMTILTLSTANIRQTLLAFLSVKQLLSILLIPVSSWSSLQLNLPSNSTQVAGLLRIR